MNEAMAIQKSAFQTSAICGGNGKYGGDTEKSIQTQNQEGRTMKLIEMLRFIDSPKIKLVTLNNKVFSESNNLSDLRKYFDLKIESIKAQQNKICIKLMVFDELSEDQRWFHNAFPEKEIDCEVPDYVSIEDLVDNIKQSKWLREANKPLSWYVEKQGYEKIIQGYFRNVE